MKSETVCRLSSCDTRFDTKLVAEWCTRANLKVACVRVGLKRKNPEFLSWISIFFFIRWMRRSVVLIWKHLLVCCLCYTRWAKRQKLIYPGYSRPKNGDYFIILMAFAHKSLNNKSIFEPSVIIYINLSWPHLATPSARRTLWSYSVREDCRNTQLSWSF